MTMPDATKQCDKECRIQFGVGMTTCVYYPPVYDKHGNNVNPDGNITSGECACITCGKEWRYSTQFEQTTYTEKPCN